MDFFWTFIGIGVPVIVIIGLINERRKRRRLEAYSALAKGLGMEFDEATLLSNRSIHGIYLDRAARIEDSKAQNHPGYKITLVSMVPFTGYLSMEKPRYGELGYFLSQMGWSLNDGVIKSGDRDFDRRVVVRTNNEVFFKSIIDSEIRSAFLNLDTGKLRVDGGLLTYETTGYMPNNLENISRALKMLRNIEKRLDGGIVTTPEQVNEYDETGLLKF